MTHTLTQSNNLRDGSKIKHVVHGATGVIRYFFKNGDDKLIAVILWDNDPEFKINDEASPWDLVTIFEPNHQYKCKSCDLLDGSDKIENLSCAVCGKKMDLIRGRSKMKSDRQIIQEHEAKKEKARREDESQWHTCEICGTKHHDVCLDSDHDQYNCQKCYENLCEELENKIEPDVDDNDDGDRAYDLAKEEGRI